MSLTYILATRERSTDLLKTLTATIPNMTRDDTKLLVCADLDDEATCETLLSVKLDSRVIVSILPREDSRGEKYDRALTAAPGSLYLVGHDCAPILTKGFDQIFLDRAETCFPDGIGVVNSPMANASFPGFQAITAGLVKKIGYIYNNDYPYWFIDHELDDIARMIGRNPFVDVVVDIASRRPGRTLRLRDLNFWTTYFDCHTLDRVNMARSIIDGADFLAPLHIKEILRNSWQPVVSRSMFLHQQIRGQAAQMERDRGEPGRAPDAGYVRLKAKAEAKIAAMRAEMLAAA